MLTRSQVASSIAEQERARQAANEEVDDQIVVYNHSDRMNSEFSERNARRPPRSEGCVLAESSIPREDTHIIISVSSSQTDEDPRLSEQPLTVPVIKQQIKFPPQVLVPALHKAMGNTADQLRYIVERMKEEEQGCLDQLQFELGIRTVFEDTPYTKGYDPSTIFKIFRATMQTARDMLELSAIGMRRTFSVHQVPDPAAIDPTLTLDRMLDSMEAFNENVKAATRMAIEGQLSSQ